MGRAQKLKKLRKALQYKDRTKLPMAYVETGDQDIWVLRNKDGKDVVERDTKKIKQALADPTRVAYQMCKKFKNYGAAEVPSFKKREELAKKSLEVIEKNKNKKTEEKLKDVYRPN